MGRKLAWPPIWANLARAAGGVDALAETLGVSRQQVARWALGKNRLRASTKTHLYTLLRKQGWGVKLPFEPEAAPHDFYDSPYVPSLPRLIDSPEDFLAKMHALHAEHLRPQDREVREAVRYVVSRFKARAALNEEEEMFFGHARDWPEGWSRLAHFAGGAGKLAAMLGVTRQQLFSWVRGRTKPKGKRLASIQELVEQASVSADPTLTTLYHLHRVERSAEGRRLIVLVMTLFDLHRIRVMHEGRG